MAKRPFNGVTGGVIGGTLFVGLYEIFQRVVNQHAPSQIERAFAFIAGGFTGEVIEEKIKSRKSNCEEERDFVMTEDDRDVFMNTIRTAFLSREDISSLSTDEQERRWEKKRKDVEAFLEHPMVTDVVVANSDDDVVNAIKTAGDRTNDSIGADKNEEKLMDYAESIRSISNRSDLESFLAKHFFVIANDFDPSAQTHNEKFRAVYNFSKANKLDSATKVLEKEADRTNVPLEL